MRPAPFAYHRADSIDHALDLLAQHGEDARLIAGGQSLVPMMNLRLARPEVLIDIDRLDLEAVTVGIGEIAVGALARHEAVLSDARVATLAPVIPEVLAHVGHPTIRRRGTAGGSLAHADPTAEWSALLLLLDGEVEARAKTGDRRIAADDFFDSAFTTALEPGEMIAGLRLRLPQGTWGGSFMEFAEREGDFAIAAVGVTLTRRDGAVDEARIVLAGAETRPLRARKAESMLSGEGVTEALARTVARAATEGLDCLEDLRASAAYRRHLFTVLTEQAILRATARSGEAP